MRKFIVITTIQDPTEAVRAFARLKHWQLVVVGDKKTPAGWQCEKAVYLPPAAQKKYDFGLPWNNYCRKMIGYLYAMKAGATHIAESDDDNIPQENWGFPAHEGEFARYDSNLYDTVTGAGFVNVYKYFTKDNIWPRGFPLDKIKRETPALRPLSEGFRVGVWQGLADNDPDVDAIYRLTTGAPCVFAKRAPVVLGKYTLCPFNSQNTFFPRELFALMYLPVTVAPRFADILRGYVAQPIMWTKDYLLGFTSATVEQRRNKHNLLSDFRGETACYFFNDALMAAIMRAVDEEATPAANLLKVYAALVKCGVCERSELKYLKSWLTLIGAK